MIKRYDFHRYFSRKNKALYYNIDSRNLLKYLGGKMKWQQ